MQIELKVDSHVKYYDGFTKEKLNTNIKYTFGTFFKTLGIYLNDKLVARFSDIQLHQESFENKLIIYSHKNKTKIILLEATGSNDEVAKLRSLVHVHNRFFGFKSPLLLNYAKETRDSVLVSEKEANLRGFMNLFIIFSVLNYWRLISDNMKKHSTVFKDTVFLLGSHFSFEHDGLLRFFVFA